MSPAVAGRIAGLCMLLGLQGKMQTAADLRGPI